MPRNGDERKYTFSDMVGVMCLGYSVAAIGFIVWAYVSGEWS